MTSVFSSHLSFLFVIFPFQKGLYSGGKKEIEAETGNWKGFSRPNKKCLLNFRIFTNHKSCSINQVDVLFEILHRFDQKKLPFI